MSISSLIMARIREPRLLLAVVCLLAMVGYSVGDQAVGLEFALEIDGKEVSAKELDGVEIDDIEIEPIAMMPTAAGEDVVYCPGTAKYGNVAIRALPGSGLALALYQWWLDCSQGKNIRKNMSVIAKNKDVSSFCLPLVYCFKSAGEICCELLHCIGILAVTCQSLGLSFSAALDGEKSFAEGGGTTLQPL